MSTGETAPQSITTLATSPVCPNCGAGASGRWCQACGQDNRYRTPRVRDWLAEAIDTLFSVDGRWPRTLRELTVDPGGLVRRYVSGQRVRYVAPVRYALVTCSIWWLFVFLQLPDLSDERIPPGLRVALLYGQPLNLAMLPPIALLFRAAFAGRGSSYAEHLCFVLLACGHAFLWRAGLALAGYFWPSIGPSVNQWEPRLFFAYLAFTLWGWQRPRRSPPWRHAVLFGQIAVALVGLYFASDLLLRQGIALLVWWRG